MQSKSESRFFKWFGTAAVGTLAGLAVGALLGLIIGGGLGGYLWYEMRHDGLNAFSDDTEHLFGFIWMVMLAVIGAVIGLVTGGLAGLTISSLYAALLGSPKKP